MACGVQNVKVAVGLEKPLGKEGAGSMEPAGIMENKCASCLCFRRNSTGATLAKSCAPCPRANILGSRQPSLAKVVNLWCRSGEGSRAEQYADLIASKKQKSDELTKGARVEELYSEAPVRAQAQNKPEDRKPFRHEEP